MRRALIATLVASACLASAGGGFWLGFREAWYLGIDAEALPRGVVATHHLRYLRAGTPGPVIVGLEFDVDIGLSRGTKIIDHPLRPLFGPLWGVGEHPGFERHAAQLANHRRRFPSLLEPDSFNRNPGMVQDAQETKSRIDRAIERFGAPK